MHARRIAIERRRVMVEAGELAHGGVELRERGRGHGKIRAAVFGQGIAADAREERHKPAIDGPQRVAVVACERPGHLERKPGAGEAPQ